MISTNPTFQLHVPPAVQVPRGSGEHICQQGQAEGACGAEAEESLLCGHQASWETKVGSVSHNSNIVVNRNCLDPEPGLCLQEDFEDSLPPQPGQPRVAMKEGQGEKRQDPNFPNLKPQLLSQSLSTCFRTRRKLLHRG